MCIELFCGMIGLVCWKICHVCRIIADTMGCYRWVASIKIQMSFAKPYKNKAFSQEKISNLETYEILANPYACWYFTSAAAYIERLYTQKKTLKMICCRHTITEKHTLLYKHARVYCNTCGFINKQSMCEYTPLQIWLHFISMHRSNIAHQCRGIVLDVIYVTLVCEMS